MSRVSKASPVCPVAALAVGDSSDRGLNHDEGSSWVEGQRQCGGGGGAEAGRPKCCSRRPTPWSTARSTAGNAAGVVVAVAGGGAAAAIGVPSPPHCVSRFPGVCCVYRQHATVVQYSSVQFSTVEYTG